MATHIAPACTWVAIRADSHSCALSNDWAFVQRLSGAALSERCAPIHQNLVCGGIIRYQPKTARAKAVCRSFNVQPVLVKTIECGSNNRGSCISVRLVRLEGQLAARVFGSDKHQNVILRSKERIK